MGIDVSKADVQKMLEGKGWLKKYVGEVSGDQDALEDLADEIADAIEDDPSLVQKVLKATSFNRSFVHALVDELD
ncbi:hypothetical protein MYX64_05220 [Nitrospinae bacterium AH_259_B05_G02_I21]|nr:hypothetical protein [Nitrospinae bacterium AH_259_B05_G02_I21]MDA2931687.1 hypothetical protein [Nitrospinae bacterium AH-259-F20]